MCPATTASRFTARCARPILDIALGIHAMHGLQMRRGYEFWFAEGDALENRFGDNPHWERLRKLLLGDGTTGP